MYVFDPRIPMEGAEDGCRFGGRSVARHPVAAAYDTVSLRCGCASLSEERLLAPLGYQALASIPLIVEDKVLGTLDIAHFESRLYFMNTGARRNKSPVF